MSHFREQLVCAQLAASKYRKIGGPVSENELDTLLSNAQGVATACCEAWGHPWNDREPNGKPAKGATCTRCGKGA